MDEPGLITTPKHYQYPQYDHRGSVCTLTDIAGNVIATYKYDAWGNILQCSESADVVAAGNRFKYQSNWMYLKEGVYLSPARLYHAQYGSFLQQDPLYKVGFLAHAFDTDAELITPEIPDELYTAAIGSAFVYVTLDSVDCKKKEATINVWMYNDMTKESFGKNGLKIYKEFYPNKTPKMSTQYMWWNWKEDYCW